MSLYWQYIKFIEHNELFLRNYQMRANKRIKLMVFLLTFAIIFSLIGIFLQINSLGLHPILLVNILSIITIWWGLKRHFVFEKKVKLFIIDFEKKLSQIRKVPNSSVPLDKVMDDCQQEFISLYNSHFNA